MRIDVENPIVVDSYWRNRADNNDAHLMEEIEKEVPCSVCGYHDLEGNMIDSERWEDFYLCGYKDCNDKHYAGWAESMDLQKYYVQRG